jgi:hypothetical protein
MKRIGRALIAVPLLFVVACVDIADEGDGESSTSQAVEFLHAPDAPAGPTQDPRSPKVSPTISPSVVPVYVAPNGAYSCASGNLCTGVWDPVAAKWKIFRLFNCNTYSLNNWLGRGFRVDNQTGNVTSLFLDQFGINVNAVSPFSPGGGQVDVNWDPVWFIKNC